VTSSRPDGAGHGAGYNHFDNLQPGTYTITEGVATGYIHVDQTQGTTGDGAVSTRQFSNIHLAAGVNGRNNEFGEEKVPVQYMAVLSGIRYEPSVITLTLVEAPNPATVTNPANYTVVGVSGPNTGPVAVASVSYNAPTNQVSLLLANQVNFHYHYEVSAHFNGRRLHAGLVVLEDHRGILPPGDDRRRTRADSNPGVDRLGRVVGLLGKATADTRMGFGSAREGRQVARPTRSPPMRHAVARSLG
jgi:hypothetical protein